MYANYKREVKCLNRHKMMLVNYIMLISLVVVFVSGILVKMMPGMWLGMTHTFSSIILFVCAIIHCIQHKMLKR